jgi:hypothetical protein
MCFVRISAQTTIISLYSINWLVFISETKSVYCAVRTTGSLNIIQVMCYVWISEQTVIISLYSINWLVCVTETECVYCEVRTEFSHLTLKPSCCRNVCARGTVYVEMFVTSSDQLRKLYHLSRKNTAHLYPSVKVCNALLRHCTSTLHIIVSKVMTESVSVTWSGNIPSFMAPEMSLPYPHLTLSKP